MADKPVLIFERTDKRTPTHRSNRPNNGFPKHIYTNVHFQGVLFILSKNSLILLTAIDIDYKIVFFKLYPIKAKELVGLRVDIKRQRATIE